MGKRGGRLSRICQLISKLKGAMPVARSFRVRKEGDKNLMGEGYFLNIKSGRHRHNVAKVGHIVRES